MGENGLRKSTLNRAVRFLLECTICLDPCASPIHSCKDNGHLICGICFDKMGIVKCPLCECLSIAVNALAERQSRQNDMLGVCPYIKSGCEGPILAANLKAHIPTCEYRIQGCGELCALSEYPGHLNRVHKIRPTKNESLKTKFSFAQVFNPNDPVSKNYWDEKPTSRFSSSILEFDGKHFALQAVLGNRQFYWWVTIFSGQKEADRYISHSAFVWESDKKSSQYILPVLPFNLYEKYDENCGHYGIIHAATLANCSEYPRAFNVCMKLTITKLPEASKGSGDDAKKLPANYTEGTNSQKK